MKTWQIMLIGMGGYILLVGGLWFMAQQSPGPIGYSVVGHSAMGPIVVHQFNPHNLSE
jgi:hypothetical protein